MLKAARSSLSLPDLLQAMPEAGFWHMYMSERNKAPVLHMPALPCQLLFIKLTVSSVSSDNGHYAAGRL